MVVGLGVLSAAELILDPLGLGSAQPFIVVFTLLGFPLASDLAWAYQLTPEGVEREAGRGPATEAASGTATAEYVVEGSVRKAGDSLRITAQLISAESDEHLWAETYARELEDVFEIHDPRSPLALQMRFERH